MGAAIFTSSRPTMIAGDSIKAKAATINPSKGIFWLDRKLSAVINVTALIEPYAAAIAAELNTFSFILRIRKQISGIINDIIMAAKTVGMTGPPKPLLSSSRPPLNPIARKKV